MAETETETETQIHRKSAREINILNRGMAESFAECPFNGGESVVGRHHPVCFGGSLDACSRRRSPFVPSVSILCL